MCLTFRHCLPYRSHRAEGGMRTRGDTMGITSKPDSPTEQSGKTSGGKRLHLKLPKLRGNKKGQTKVVVTDGHGSVSTATVECPRVPLTFEQNLEQHCLFEACLQLIEREERLSGQITEEKEVSRLAKDRGALLSLVELILKKSFSPGEENLEALASALKAICQEEQQDRLWAQRHEGAPEWRPSHWREHHNSTLRRLVEERMDNAETPVTPDKMQRSSIQRHICGMGKQLKDDLKQVVEVVKGCYPPEFDICNFYARLYHRAFGARLRKITEFGLEEADCTTLLCWVNNYYPNILQQQELVTEINSEALGELLPKEVLENLEGQHLSNTEEKLQRFIKEALKKEEEAWANGEEPERSDGCFISHLAIDVIQFINSAVESLSLLLRDEHKVQRTACLLENFLQSFTKFQGEVMARSKSNSKQVVMANLHCMEQLRDFIDKKRHLFPEDVRQRCLSAVTAMKKSSHTYLLGPMHKELKPQYRTLGTNDWLRKLLFEKLLQSIESHIEDLQGLTGSCHQELMGQLQYDVTVEYVRRLLKGNVKLKDKEKQEQAARMVTENGKQLHQLFTEAGSKEDWLKDILPNIAEVLRLQDLPSLQLEVASLGAAYPDLSEKHISALLKLKTSLSKDDRRKVKESLLDGRTDTSDGDLLLFFSRVQIR
ncbi:tumor necrosis factor alpha-induced protein 2-like isoform X2 [Myripristis murdjan]|uniref:tumor necrosis factor alpha-induced protein 2-like isoform X2 n=1 Tax=Myripristis murdjan TaxID=586833 RepID=UPI001176097C|nr:tumor necrosis factor alpha-induced protein 2-like isoform X2 [Myripristis murdjan]